MCLGVPAQITEVVDASANLVKVRLSGVLREVNVACVLGAEYPQIGDLLNKWVLVHVGFALSVIDEQEAQHTLQVLDEIGEMAALQEDLKEQG